jgi:hypothetical protein
MMEVNIGLGVHTLERPSIEFVEIIEHLGKAVEHMIGCMTCCRDNCISDHIRERQRVIIEVIAKRSSYGLQ